MKDINTKKLRLAVSEYARPSTGLAIFIFSLDIIMYLALIAGVIFLESIVAKLICSIVAGLKIASIFVIAHDAAHGAYTNNKKLNSIIGRIAFLPSLHNYSLWVIEHNRVHHQSTNVKNLDSWSPLSKEEYDELPQWRKSLEKLYRCPIGIPIYYLIERWWKNKFYPFSDIKGRNGNAYLDFLFVIISFLGYASILIYAGMSLSHTSPVELIILGLIIPFAIWNFMMGFTVYQHHTHETIPWNKTKNDREALGGQEDFTMHVKYPAWFNLISHNIMEHTAHHVDPRIPLYKLAKAQKALAEMMGDDMRIINFSLRGFLNTMSKCKLYDYENHCWLDFNGNPTAWTLDEDSDFEYADAA